MQKRIMRGNRQLVVEEETLPQYLEQGYLVMDENSGEPALTQREKPAKKAPEGGR